MNSAVINVAAAVALGILAIAACMMVDHLSDLVFEIETLSKELHNLKIKL